MWWGTPEIPALGRGDRKIRGHPLGYTANSRSPRNPPQDNKEALVSYSLESSSTQ